ncbi:hypothetical protein DSC45_34325 [Streptomyces sp. YIM 130001]|uniref:DUF6069 family protein n=1 Tax=Streptomyces sp. YIM 130001 TaxID=2259644 RepID=UPI000EDC9F29|nr:DUF6069 family protein [Streptomyces sp. YIM 130001]RII07904.1 hypothetical protein DSC45_34325 [Streptomyces sp. YIM 130001]
MSSMKETPLATAPAAHRTSRPRRFHRLAGTGLIATLAATAATTLVAALARTAGADFKVQGGQTIPLSGIAIVTGFFSAAGIVIAAALLRLTARPAERFVWTATSLTVISLIPPLVSEATTPTTIALLGLHLVPAAVMIPALTRSLDTRAG